VPPHSAATPAPATPVAPSRTEEPKTAQALSVVAASVVPGSTAPVVAKGPPAVPTRMPPPPVPEKPANNSSQETLTTMLATFLTQVVSQGGGTDPAKLAEITQSMSSIVAQANTQHVAEPAGTNAATPTPSKQGGQIIENPPVPPKAGNPLALECAMRFRRQREETDQDEGKYYPWKDTVAFHDGDATKALEFISRRRLEPKGTSSCRNNPGTETFLYYGLQTRTLTQRTLDEIAVDMGCSPSYAASVCSMLDGETAMPSGIINEDPNPKPPPPKPENKKNRNGGNGGQNEGANATTNTTENLPNKKARPAKPQGSDLELHVCGDDTGAFVKNWVAAANNAQGQATRVCGELPVCMGSELRRVSIVIFY
ncbi:unnamed protein product, partial [Symbiodinium necroappetens]